MKNLMQGTHHIGIPTNKMDDTIAFYSKLGAEVVMKKGELEAGKPIQVVLMEWGNLIVELYERDEIAMQTGPLDHLAMRVTDLKKAYEYAVAEGFEFFSNGIEQSSYWQKEISYFMIIGCNGERIEFTEGV